VLPQRMAREPIVHNLRCACSLTYRRMLPQRSVQCVVVCSD
jgi:hypothetical protein